MKIMEGTTLLMRWLRDKAEKGSLRAQYRLGLWYYYGRHSFPVDEKKGLEWLIRAGKAGYKKAQKKVVEIVPSNYFNSDSDLNDWLRYYDPSEYDRQNEIHQMML